MIQALWALGAREKMRECVPHVSMGEMSRLRPWTGL